MKPISKVYRDETAGNTIVSECDFLFDIDLHDCNHISEKVGRHFMISLMLNRE